MRQVIAAVLVLGISSPAFADIRTSANSAGARAAAVQARPNAQGNNDDNPYFLPAVIMMSGGGLVAVYGLTHDTGVACGTGKTSTSFSCGVTKSKATIFTGLGIVGVGTYLFYKGKRQQKSSPQIVVGPHGIGVHHTW